MRRKGKTFDVVGEIPSNHHVKEFGYSLHYRRLDHATRVSPDTGLTGTR